ncbi:AAA family ATPase [Noviherbaspirillum malthae]|uniref:AAA family ATPase n=1 Tax=Noviherbaspirillum malthae TaxID=1260987 RepID=UPI0018902D29|nr:AAA family ATPase [Noviherbaspirillum malthae]
MPISVSGAPHALLPQSLISPEAYSESTQVTRPESSGHLDISQRPVRPYSLVATATRWRALHQEYARSQQHVMPRLKRILTILMHEAGIPMATTLATSTAVYLASRMLDPASSPQEEASNARGQAAPAGLGHQPSWSFGDRSALIGGISATAATLVKDLIPALIAAGKKAYLEDDKDMSVKILRYIHEAFRKEEKEFFENSHVLEANKKALQKLNDELDRAFAATFDEMLRPAGNLSPMERGIEMLKEDLERYVWIRAIPQTPKNVSHMENGGDLAARMRIDQNVKALVAGYEPTLQSRLTDYVATVRQKSLDGNGASLLYLAGSPGTGKTHLAKNLAKALELPYIKIMAKGKRLDQIFGQKDGEGIYGIRSDKPLLERMGDFFVKLIASEPNAIIHLEEFGDEFNSDTVCQILQDLKERLDRETLAVPELFQAVIPNQLNIIVTSNTTMTPDLLPENSRDSLRALMSRITYLEMPPIPDGLKETLAEKAWDTAIDNLRRNANPVEPVNALKKLVISMVLEEDKVRDVPGTRLVERITGAVAAQIFSKKYDGVYDMTSEGHDISTAYIKQLIENRFDESLLNETPKTSSARPGIPRIFSISGGSMDGRPETPLTGLQFRRSMGSIRRVAGAQKEAPAANTSNADTSVAENFIDRAIQTEA